MNKKKQIQLFEIDKPIWIGKRLFCKIYFNRYNFCMIDHLCQFNSFKSLHLFYFPIMAPVVMELLQRHLTYTFLSELVLFQPKFMQPKTKQNTAHVIINFNSSTICLMSHWSDSSSYSPPLR